MGKRKHRDRAERQARENRRVARAQASLMRHQLLDAGINPEDIVSLNAEGFVGKHAHVEGTPENWQCPTCEGQGHFGEPDDEDDCWDCGGTGRINSVTPPDENGSHDPATTTG